MREVALSIELLEIHVKKNFPDVFSFHFTCNPFGGTPANCCQAWVECLWEGEPREGQMCYAPTIRAALSNLCDELNLGGSDADIQRPKTPGA